jgi:hypothetical protein
VDDKKLLDDEQADVLDAIEEDLEEVEDEAIQDDDMVKRDKAEIARTKLKEFRKAADEV